MSFLSILSLPFLLVDQALLLLVTANDKLIYSPLQLHLIPLVAKIPRDVSIGGVKLTVFTANGVTFARTSLVILMATCLKYDYTVSACLLVLLNDIMDHLDGIVAKAQRRIHGNVDSPLLGAFLDAFCDKVVNILLLWTILLLTDFSAFSTYQLLVFVVVCSSIICFETVLGIVRVQDYYKAKYSQSVNATSTATPSIQANMEGKTKEKLENVGLSLVCLGMANANPLNTWVGCVGITCLALSLRFAYGSLMHKINARRKATAATHNDTQTQTVTDTDTGEDMVFDVPHQNGFAINNYMNSEPGQSISRRQSAPIFRLDSSSSESDGVFGQHSDNEQNDNLADRKKVDKIYTVGCFDLFHRGHKKLLKNMRSLGREVIVGIHDDESYFKLKKKHTIDKIEKRMANVKEYADQVFVISNTDPTPYLLCCIHLQPSQTALYVRGDDMPRFPGRSVVEPMMPIQLLPYTQGVSSTMLRAELLKETGGDCPKEQEEQTEDKKLKKA